jgi:hypothetical protein
MKVVPPESELARAKEQLAYLNQQLEAIDKSYAVLSSHALALTDPIGKATVILDLKRKHRTERRHCVALIREMKELYPELI